MSSVVEPEAQSEGTKFSCLGLRVGLAFAMRAARWFDRLTGLGANGRRQRTLASFLWQGLCRPTVVVHAGHEPHGSLDVAHRVLCNRLCGGLTLCKHMHGTGCDSRVLGHCRNAACHRPVMTMSACATHLCKACGICPQARHFGADQRTAMSGEQHVCTARRCMERAPPCCTACQRWPRFTSVVAPPN